MFNFSKIVLGGALYLGMATAYALPLGNIADPALYQKGCVLNAFGSDSSCDPCSLNLWEYLNLRTGYYGDFVFKRHTELVHSSDVDHASLTTNAGLIVLDFCNRLDIFTTLGATNGALELRSGTALTFIPTSPLPRFFFETGTNFSWSVGGRAILWELGCTYFGIEGQYFRTRQHIRAATVAALITENPPSQAAVIYSEWQVGLGLAHRFAFAVPYVGVKWAGSKSIAQVATLLGGATSDLESKKLWGFAVGVTLIACETVGVTVEGRFGDEKAVHVNGQIRF